MSAKRSEAETKRDLFPRGDTINGIIGLDELKSKAIDEIKGEFVTKDFLRAEISEVRAEIADVRAGFAEVRTEIAKTKNEILRWVIGLQISTIVAVGAMLKFML